MNIKGHKINVTQLICLVLYYGIAYWLPGSYSVIMGRLCKRIRYALCKRIFQRCGSNVNIERKANFGVGLEIQIGNNSGLSNGCVIPSNTIIGNDVMMGPNCYILDHNHCYSRTDIPMNQQGKTRKYQTIIEDDVWIGRDVLMTPGRIIKTGTIVAAGCVLCKDFPEFSIVGGNPSKLIKSRK